MYQIVNEAPQKTGSSNHEIPDMLDIVVLKCLAKRPEDRYQNADNLADDLHSCRVAVSHVVTGSTIPAEVSGYEL
jgi:serine/threonine-protein kinase